MRFFDRYTGFFRRVKLFYTFHNIAYYRWLKTNKERYRQAGLQRPVWASLSSKHFKQQVSSSPNPHSKEWEERGLLHLKSFFSEEYVDDINNKIEQAIADKKIVFNYTQRKIVFAFNHVPELKEIINHPKLNQQLRELGGEEVIPFQSINFIKGSEQKAHSDSVHMATFPEGGLIAFWVALDDIDHDNGPLFYYPGSHTLKYANNADMNNKTGWLLSANPNANYEKYVQSVINEHNLEKEVLSAKKGDVIVWHANLLHGGMPHLNEDKTRRSMVVHFFYKGRICYHELSQRPAIIKPI